MKFNQRSTFVSKAASLSALLTVSLLGGCTTLLGGNVKGNFACRAPGGTCAPTQVIDDQALGGTPDDGAPPAALGEPTPASSARRTTLEASPPPRTNQRVLRIVFPPRIDQAGRYHEASAIHAVVSRSVWADRRDPTSSASDAAALIPAADLGLAALAASAPNLALAPDPSDDAGASPAPAPPIVGIAATRMKGSALAPSPIEDAKRKVLEAFGASRSGANGVAPIPTTARALPVIPNNTPVAQAFGKAKTPNSPPITDVKTSAKVTLAPVPTSNQSSAQSVIKTVKTSNFPGRVDTGGDQ